MEGSVSFFLDLTVPRAPREAWDPVSEAQFLLREMGQQHKAPARAGGSTSLMPAWGWHTRSPSHPWSPPLGDRSPLGVVCTSSLTSAKPMESIALAQKPPSWSP